MKYSVKFAFNDHKFKMLVDANSVEQAEQVCLSKVRDKIKFDAVEKVNDFPDLFRDIFKMDL